jgi:peptide/nickel transport system permease protein
LAGLLVNAVMSRDFALVQAILIMVSITMILANLAVDAIYALIDPRMRAAGSEN